MTTKVVVFCPNLIGDTVMATPALRSLRPGFPDATMIGVIKPNVAPTLDGTSWLDEVVRFDPKSSDRRVHAASVWARLRAEKADLAVLLPELVPLRASGRAAGIDDGSDTTAAAGDGC